MTEKGGKAGKSSRWYDLGREGDGKADRDLGKMMSNS